MSLLLEALKKAELAKQGAQPGATLDQSAPVRHEELTLLDEPREPVITRASLPDISAPMEIHSDDLGLAKPAAEREQPARERQPSPLTESPPSAPADASPGARDAARQMFEVKEVDYNPKRPFYITIGALVTAGLGYGGYVWWQMQPHYAVNTAAVQSAPKAVPRPASPATPASPGAPSAVAEAASGPNTNQSPANPPTAREAAEKAPAPAQKPLVAAPDTPPAPAPKGPVFQSTARELGASTPRSSAPASARVASRAPEAPPIKITPATLQADPILEAAYGAYQRGNWDGARSAYERALARDPNDRDALLGLAAVDVRTRNFDTAELRYLRVLDLNPRDTFAYAGLLALQGQLNPVQSESRIKTLLAAQPDATHLYFTLGNQYAAQSRWGEAQEAYFKAYSAHPDNADYAFNLAVSLDRLRKTALARDYYRKALELGSAQPIGFNRAQAEVRAAELDR